MAHAWERTEGRRVHYAHVTAREVVVGSHAGSGHTDDAGSCTHAEFLAGRFHDAVRASLGAEVLAELLAAVRAAPDDPAFAATLGEVVKLRRMLAALPQDPSLPALLSGAEVVHGSWALYRGPRGLTLTSPEGTLAFDGLAAIVTPTQGPARRIELQGYPTGALFCGGLWLLLAGGAMLLTPSGELRSPPALTQPPWGGALRCWDVYAAGARLLFSYRFFHDADGPPGVCELRPGEGLIGQAALDGPPPFARPPNGYGG